MPLLTQKQTTQRGSINNSSKSCHQRTASSEVCCVANEQKTTVNTNSSDSFISSQLSLFVALDALMFCTPEGYTTLFTPLHYSYLRQVTLDLHTLFLSHLHALMMDEGWSNESVLHLPIPIAILRSSLIWLPDKHGPEQQKQFAFKGCSSYKSHACNSLKGTFAFWMPENFHTQNLKISVRGGMQGAKIFWK